MTMLPSDSVRGARALPIGFLALTDAAPFVAAQELRFFAGQSLRVELRRETGRARIRDGELEAARR